MPLLIMFSFKRSLLSCLALTSSFQQLLNAAHIPKHKHHEQLAPRSQEVVCGTQVIITTVYILVPVSVLMRTSFDEAVNRPPQIYINLHVSENTILPIYDYLTLDIKNAPTSINAVYTGTTSSIITQSDPVLGQHVT